MQQVRQEASYGGLPQPQNYYLDKYKNIAEAEGFYYRNVLEQYSYLQGFSAPLNFEGESAMVIEDSNNLEDAYTFRNLKDNISQLKTENVTEVLSFLKGIDLNAAELYLLIIQFVESINEIRHTQNLIHLNPLIPGVTNINLIKQVIDHAISGFSFSPDDNGILRRVIDYLNSPTRLFNIFDSLDQQKISNHFVGKALSGEDFHSVLIQHFRNYGFKVLRKENETCFYTAIIYDVEVRPLWDKPIAGAKEETISGTNTKPFSPKFTIALNDLANQKTDLLGVNREIEVFARLLAQKDLSPPLAIALFGNWGSGKSFFMNNLEANIKQLSDSDILKPDGKPFYCKEIVHITFNAWSYLDSNLWAGLVTSIFEKLNEYITQSTKSGVAKMKVVEKLRERLISFQTLKLSEEEKKAELEVLKRGYEIEQKTLEESIKSNFSKNIIQIINGEKELNAIYANIAKDGYLSTLTEHLKFDKLQQEAQPFISFFRNLKSIKYLLKYFLLALIGVGIAIGIWAAGQALGWGWTGLIPFVASLGIDWKKLLTRYNKVKEFVLQFNDIIGKNVDLKEKVDEHKKLVKNADDQIKEAEVQIIQLDEKINDFQKYMENEINQETMKDFIQTRSNHKDYIEKLGIVSIIRRDFETLSELFYESNSIEERTPGNEIDKELIRKQFKQGRTLERIILYIDDLDRCSDDKVLEVLQAVHLLMAFPLFIVVVGVDKRCVTNALYNREVSKYFLREENSEIKRAEKSNAIHIIHPDEYLEKIFQIPFQLQRPSPENIQHMIHKLLEKDIQEEIQTETNKNQPLPNAITPPNSNNVLVDALRPQANQLNQQAPQNQPEEGKTQDPSKERKPSSEPEMKQEVLPEGLKITSSEREYIKKISPLIGTTPRTIKRFINIYRLIRAHQDLTGIDEDQEYLIVIFILAMHLGVYKEKADELFYKLREDQNSRLKSILDTLEGDDFKGIRNNLELAGFENLFNVKASEFVEYLSFVRRFSFNALNEPIPMIQKREVKGNDLG